MAATKEKKPRVTFPIIRTVVYNNAPNIRYLNKGDKVTCYFCNTKFAITSRTVSIDPHDGMQMVTCPNADCKRSIPVLYYFDRVIKKKRGGRKKKSVTEEAAS